MKGFYILLAAVGIGGAGWLVYSARKKAPPAPAPAAPVSTAQPGGFPGYTLGSDSAPITITEYSDYQCPYCASFVTVQMPEVRTQLIGTGKVLWRFRDFPLPSHKYSILAAMTANCAGEQGKFWEMHDQIFHNHQWAERGKDPSGQFREFAKAIGLDGDRYDACVDSQRYAGRIEESRQEGIARGVDATPKFYFNDRRFDGMPTSDAFKHLVDSMIATPKR